jgi:hypothetical protein
MAESRCTAFDFTANSLDETENATWVGALWLNAECNWGTKLPTPVKEGATKITFWAWGAEGGEVVDFTAGGVGTLDTPYADSFLVKQSGVTLTTTPTKYELALTGYTYAGGVINAFVWSAEFDELVSGWTIYVDGIRWE